MNANGARPEPRATPRSLRVWFVHRFARVRDARRRTEWRSAGGAVAAAVAAAILLHASVARADVDDPLPSPLDAATVARLARERRPEVLAARLRAAAAAERPKIVGALPDPMVTVSMDHLPFSLMGVNGNVSVQQEFPLSGVRGARRRAAVADAGRFRAEARRTELDTSLEALDAFYMLAERRSTRAVLDEQIAIIEQLAAVARAHLASGQGMLADVLRLDNERARADAERSALVAEIRASEAMLDTALGRLPSAPLPELSWNDELAEPAAADALGRQALANRPELDAARAERARATAEIDVMQSMYSPMAFVRAGPSYMMDSGAGVMAMVGVTVPVWREKLSAGVSEARAMESMASADLDAAKRMVAGRVVSARETVLAERTRLIALQKDVLPRARLVVDSATASFGAGQGPMIAVLDATRDLRDIRMEEIMARARLGRSWAVLRREAGEYR